MTRSSLVVFGCSIFLAACSVSTSSKLASQPQPATNGISLYEKYCASCHRPFAQTTKPQRSVSRLRSAIRLFPSMNDLYFLSDVQLEAISSSLATINLQQVSRPK
jgi:cytochrome c